MYDWLVRLFAFALLVVTFVGPVLGNLPGFVCALVGLYLAWEGALIVGWRLVMWWIERHEPADDLDPWGDETPAGPVQLLP